jgi:hypothetical protein
MSFKPNLNRISTLDKFKEATEQKNLVQEIKEKQAVNHKSNVYKLIKANSELSRDEIEFLTVLVDSYYSQYLK